MTSDQMTHDVNTHIAGNHSMHGCIPAFLVHSNQKLYVLVDIRKLGQEVFHCKRSRLGRGGMCSVHEGREQIGVTAEQLHVNLRQAMLQK